MPLGPSTALQSYGSLLTIFLYSFSKELSSWTKWIVDFVPFVSTVEDSVWKGTSHEQQV